jgi:hypothetical protein
MRSWPRGVGGLFPWKEAAQLPHLPSFADFFLVPEFLIIFLKIKISNGRSTICAGKSMVPAQAGNASRDLFSRRLRRPPLPKKRREIPGGGGGAS